MTNGLTKHATEFRENGLPQHGLTDHVEDPVIRMKRRKLEAIERMSMRFKIIDIQFLQMVKKDEEANAEYPTFAILEFASFKRKIPCNFDGSRHEYTTENINLPGPKNVHTSCSAIPEHDVPSSVDAVVDEVKGDFDRVCVAWDAKWMNTAGGDPLVVGEIDGVWFLIGKWDTTAVESYIAG